jgi:hypothetical protein
MVQAPQRQKNRRRTSAHATTSESCGVTHWVLHVDMDRFIAAVGLSPKMVTRL